MASSSFVRCYGNLNRLCQFPAIDAKNLARDERRLVDARKMMASAISSGVPQRLSGTRAIKLAFLSTVPVKRVSISVSTGPGATALTRTPNAAPSSAAALAV
jgi:hypothetical protein